MSEADDLGRELRLQVATRMLHVIARVTLRVASPVRAKRLVGHVARLAPSITITDARRLGVVLEQCAGTCLSRAVTIAAMLRRAEIVIGADRYSRRSFSAHAWVERDGAVVSGGEPSRVVIARF